MDAKKQNQKAPAATGVSDLPQERRIQELLAQRRWRKARDEIKPLCKTDRARYLPLLITANIGLAREMLAKGLVSDARQVLAYLRTIAKPDQLKVLELELAGKAGDYAALVAHSLPQIAGESHKLSEVEQWKLADRLVLSFQPIPDSAPGAVHLAKETAAIHRALEAVSLSQFDGALEAVQPISQSSCFRHWKLFVKGLVAFHRNDRVKARRFFAEIASDTTPGRACQPYMYWLHDGTPPGSQAFPEHAVVLLANLAGEPGIGRLLYLAEFAWRNGDPREMYRLLRKGIEAFPSEKLDSIGAISEFCLHCLFTLPAKMHMQYAEMLHDLLERRASNGSREAQMILRVLCLLFQSDPNPPYLAAQWERFLLLCERLDGPNPQRASLAYGWLGEVLAAPAREDGYDMFPPSARPRLLDSAGAVRALCKSVELDPDNLGAHLRLATLYEQLQRKRERNRLLDAMTRRFADNKQVLILAGERCIERKAFSKGTEYLERALELDRMDPAIPEALVTAGIHQAREFFKRSRADDARRVLDRISSFAVDRADHYLRSRWTMLLRRGLLELFFGDSTQGQALLAEARAASPGIAPYLLLAHILRRLYTPGAPPFDPFTQELEGITKTQADIEQAGILLRILAFIEHRRGAPPLNAAFSLARKFLRASARRPFTRDQARQLGELILPHSRFSPDFGEFIKAILKRDRKDPLFLLYQYQHPSYGAPIEDAEQCRKKLQSIMQEAVRRKDDYTITRVQKELSRLKMTPPDPFDGMFDGEDDEEDDEEDEDEEDFDFEDLKLAEELLQNIFGPMNDRIRKRYDDREEYRPRKARQKKRRKKVNQRPEISPQAAEQSSQPQPASQPERGTPTKPKPGQLKLF